MSNVVQFPSIPPRITDQMKTSNIHNILPLPKLIRYVAYITLADGSNERVVVYARNSEEASTKVQNLIKTFGV